MPRGGGGVVSKLEESVSRIFMEAAFKLSGALSADMFFLLQTGDGKRRFCGRDSLVDDFVTGDLRFKDSDVHFRFFDDAEPFVDDDDDDVDDYIDDVEDAPSDVSEDNLSVGGGRRGKGEGKKTNDSTSSKRKCPTSPHEAPATKTSRKTLKAKKSGQKDAVFNETAPKSIPSMQDKKPNADAAESASASASAASTASVSNPRKSDEVSNYDKTGKK